MRAKISVIVPIYNVEKYLRSCLESIVAQTYQNFEVLCVNDCTPDNSMAIVEEFIEQYPDKIRRIDNESNMGLGATRDHGICESIGEYLMFIDSDDTIEQDYLERYQTAMENSAADIIVGSYARVVNGERTELPISNTEYGPWLCPSACVRMYRKSFLDAHHLDFRGIRRYEDNPFNYRCMLEGAKVTVIDYCGYNYVCNPTSITRTQNGAEKYHLFVRNLREVYEEYVESASFVAKREILEYVYLSTILSCMLLQSVHGGKKAAYSMYYDYKKQMQEMFPGYRRNKNIGMFRLKEEQRKVRYATAIFMRMDKMGFGKLLMRILSM